MKKSRKVPKWLVVSNGDGARRYCLMLSLRWVVVVWTRPADSVGRVARHHTSL